MGGIAPVIEGMKKPPAGMSSWGRSPVERITGVLFGGDETAFLAVLHQDKVGQAERDSVGVLVPA